MSRPAARWLVVGGGIGGLSTALALARAGQAVHVLERSDAFGEIGAGLQVGANATRMLHRLGVLEEVEDIAVHPAQGVMLDALTGEVLTTLTLGATYRDRYGFPYLVMHRSDLLSILLAACVDHDLITLSTAKRVVSVQADAGGAAVACDDGTSYAADVVVGADGLHSAVRRLLDDSPPVPSGYVAYRGAVPISEVAGAAGDVLIWIGPGLHLVQYPVRRGELYNQVAVFRSEAWGAGATDWGTPAELAERFAGTSHPVRAAAAGLSTDRRYPIYERPPMPTWRSGRAVLLGDAAHPMLQYLGQGACQAMEDAVCLAEQAAVDGDGIDEGLARFEALRLPRATRCQLSARPWGEVWHTDDPLTIGLRNRYLRSRAPDDYSEIDWLYEDQVASVATAGSPVRVASFTDGAGRARLGVEVDGTLRDVTGLVGEGSTGSASPMRRALGAGSPASVLAGAAGCPPADFRGWLPVVPDPTKVVAAPVNYRDHQAEMSQPAAIETMGVFLKAPSSLIGAGGQVRLPYHDRRFDQEGELGVVIGRTARHVPEDAALDVVAGYTCLLDMTMRGGEDRSVRKSFDTFTPLGPYLVTPDEAGPPEGMELRCWVGGHLRQRADVADLIWGVPRLIAYISSVMSLEPGDVIATGTPAGVGPVADGEEVAVEITGLGRLEVTLSAEGATACPTRGRDSGPVPPAVLTPTRERSA